MVDYFFDTVRRYISNLNLYMIFFFYNGDRSRKTVVELMSPVEVIHCRQWIYEDHK